MSHSLSHQHSYDEDNGLEERAHDGVVCRVVLLLLALRGGGGLRRHGAVGGGGGVDDAVHCPGDDVAVVSPVEGDEAFVAHFHPARVCLCALFPSSSRPPSLFLPSLLRCLSFYTKLLSQQLQTTLSSFYIRARCAAAFSPENEPVAASLFKAL